MMNQKAILLAALVVYILYALAGCHGGGVAPAKTPEGGTSPAMTPAATPSVTPAMMPSMTPAPTGSASPGATVKPAKSAKYTCSMHPEVISDKPGKCPKCGMELVPVSKP